VKLAGFLLSVILAFSGLSHAASLTISTAMGVKNLISLSAKKFQEKRGIKVYVNGASSGKLIKQIEFGFPCDVYVSASKFWVDYGIKKGILLKDTVTPFAKTRLVLVAPKNSRKRKLIEAQRIAVGNKLAPVGKYALETLKNLGIYDKVKDKLIFAPNVRQVTIWVATGNVDFGIVYYSDYLLFKDKMKLIEIFPDNLHDPIEFYVSCVKGGNVKTCTSFEKELLNLPPSAFESFGFEKVKNAP